MHVRDRAFRSVRRRVDNVSQALVRHELLVHRHLQLGNVAVRAKDLAQMAFVHVFGELLDHDLGAAWAGGAARAGT